MIDDIFLMFEVLGCKGFMLFEILVNYYDDLVVWFDLLKDLLVCMKWYNVFYDEDLGGDFF